MTLTQLLRSLWSRRAVLVASAAMAALASGLLVGLQGPQYEARAAVLMTQPAVLVPGDFGFTTQQKLNLLTFTFSTLSSSQAFVDEAIKAEGLRSSTSLGVTAEPIPNTSVFEIVVQAASSSEAADAANALQAAVRREIERPPPDGSPAIRASLIEEPMAELASAAPLFVVFAATVIGLALGATVALLLDSRD